MSNAQSKNNTMRKQSLTLQPKSNTPVQFRDTKPNHFHINSYSPGNVYMIVQGIASPTKYDMMVGDYGANIYGQPTGTALINIYNDSAVPVSIQLTTMEEAFNPSVLVGSGGPAGSSGGGGVAESVSINGFSAPLPAGANDIGKVVVTQMPAQTFTLDTLPAGTNNIGKVDVNTLPPLAAGNSKIGGVDVLNGLTISSMPPMDLSGAEITITNTEFTLASVNDHVHYNASIGTTEVSYALPKAVKSFEFITNDDPTNDVLIAFNTATTADAETGLNAVIRLKAGETLTQFKKNASIIKFIRAAGTGNVRFLGV